MKKVLFVILLLVLSTNVLAQIKIGDNPKSISPSSLLELESKDKGLLMPRVHRDSLLKQPLMNAPNGTMVYIIEGDSLMIRSNNSWISLMNKDVPEIRDIYLFVDDLGARRNDNSFDNSAIIQKGVDSAISSGKILVFGKGTYNFKNTVFIRKFQAKEHDEGIKIIGYGINQSILLSNVDSKPLFVIENAFHGNGVPIPGYFFMGGYIKNIEFQGTSKSGNAINITGWWYGKLENIKIRNFGGNGINMPMKNNFGPPYDNNGNAYTDNYSSFISISNSQIDNNMGWGYYDEKENTSSDLYCDKTVFASNRKGGIRFGGQSLRIIGGAIAYNGFGSPDGGGIELGVNGNSSHNNYMTQIEFDGNHQYHIKMNSVINTRIMSCRFLFHDLIDPTKIAPTKGGILLATDSLYPYARNVYISDNFIRVDYPTKAFSPRQSLYFTRFLSHASCSNIYIENNLFQSLPTGFTAYHDFTRYDYYFDSRLGIEYNITINDPEVGTFYPTARGKLPPSIDGIIKNTSLNNTETARLNFSLPFTYGGNNILNLSEYMQFYDSTNSVFTVPESGYYEINLGISAITLGSTGKLSFYYYLNDSQYSEHKYFLNNGDNYWISDRFILYCYKGLALSFKISSTVGLTLNPNQSKVFIKLMQ